MLSFHDRLYISTIADDAHELAVGEGLGIELAEFCTAYNMDEDFAHTDALARASTDGIERLTFHAPYSELCPAAIDPQIRAVTAERYRQAIAIAKGYGIRKLVIHSGYIPFVYFPEWFIPESVRFWTEFLTSMDEDIVICLENVMEGDPSVTTEIAAGVNDPRLRLCLDVGHANTCLSKVPVSEWIAPMAPYLAHAHIHNNEGDMDIHSPLGNGMLDIRALIDSIESHADGVTYTIENLHAQESIEWLHQNKYL